MPLLVYQCLRAINDNGKWATLNSSILIQGPQGQGKTCRSSCFTLVSGFFLISRRTKFQFRPFTTQTNINQNRLRLSRNQLVNIKHQLNYLFWLLESLSRPSVHSQGVYTYLYQIINRFCRLWFQTTVNLIDEHLWWWVPLAPYIRRLLVSFVNFAYFSL